MIAVGAVAITVAVRVMLGPVLSGRAPFLLFVPAVVVAIAYGGLEAGALAAAMGALAGGLVLARDPAWHAHTPAAIVSLAVYGLAAVLILVVGDRQRRLRQSAESEADRRAKGEERLHVMLASISDAVVATDTAGRVTFLNSAAEQLSGWSPQEALGRRFSDVLQPRDGTADPGALVGQVLREARPISTREPVLLKGRNGEEYAADESAAPIVDEQGRVHGAILTLRDISGRRRDQEALRRQAEMLDLAHDAIFVHDLDGHITFWNAGAERMYGFTREEAIGRDVRELLRTRYPQPRDTIGETLEAEGYWAGELTHTCKDGHEVVVSSRWALQRRPDGRPLAILEITRDITERRRSEAALRESEARLKAILDTAVDAVITIDEHGIVEGFNSAGERLFGYDAEDVIGRNVSMLMPSPYREEHDEYLAHFVRTGEARIIGIGREVEGLRRDGTTFPLDLAVSEALIGDRRIFVGMIRDITERKKLEEQLRQAQKMEGIGRLAGGVAHDFNNLLTAIMGYTELAREAVPEPDPVRGYLQNVEKAATRAAGLTRQLLAFARKQIIEPRVLNLNELILEINGMLRRIIGEDIELVTAPSPALGLAKVDPSQFEQILVNLVVNARDAMPGGGKLTIETSNVALDQEYARQHPEVTPGEYVMVGVTDTGQGMSEDVRTRIFEPFFTTKEQGKGTGLGLAMCYGIVKQSGGHIWVYSEPGRGTTFKVYFPRVWEAGVPYQREEAGLAPRGGETVLVVEDEPLVRETAVQALRAQGYTVLEAENGEEGLRVAQGFAGHIDLVVTDVVMPQMGGRELVEQLSLQRPGIRSLFTSGYTDHAIVRHGVLEPGILFLQKPFTPGVLARRVREALDSPDVS